jgi:hypothetical protein
MLLRDLGIDVALSTINDAVLRAGELLIPIIDWMKRDLLAGNYVQADETHVGVQTPDKKGANHTAYFWQYSAPGKGVIFDFEMTRSKEVPKAFFKDYGGILHTDCSNEGCGYSLFRPLWLPQRVMLMVFVVMWRCSKRPHIDPHTTLFNHYFWTCLDYAK